MELAPRRCPQRRPCPPRHGPVDYVWRDAVTDRLLLAADPLLVPDLPSWAAPFGALAFEEPGALPVDLRRFLAAGPPPVFVGLGSMTSREAAAVTRMVVTASLRTGRRVLLSSGWAGLGGAELPPSVMVIGDVLHRLLFPRVFGVVHHGGAGTTHAALRAGVPQLLVPHMLDQRYWAARVVAAGLGPQVVPCARPMPHVFEMAFHAFLDPELRTRARLMARKVIPDGTTELVRHLEGAFLKSPLMAGRARGSSCGSFLALLNDVDHCGGDHDVPGTMLVRARAACGAQPPAIGAADNLSPPLNEARAASSIALRAARTRLHG